MVNIEHREEKNENALAKIRDNYDFILIDCSPSLGLITINSLHAADSWSSGTVRIFCIGRIGEIIEHHKIIQTRLNPKLELKEFCWRLRSRTSWQSSVEEVRTHFKSIAFKTIIPRNVKLRRVTKFWSSGNVHDAESKGAISYLNLAHEVLNKTECTNEQEEALAVD